MKRFFLTVCATLLAGFAFGVTFAPKEYVDKAISDSFTTDNSALVSTIQTVAPPPGNYSAVSNYAMRSVQPNTGVHFTGLSIGPYPSVLGGSTTVIEKDRVYVGKASAGSEYGGTSITYYDLFGTYTISFPKKTGTAVVDSDISTNSAVFVGNVCNIVTNEVQTFGEWSFDPVYWDEITSPPFYIKASGLWGMSITGSDLFARGGPDATRLEWHYEDDLDGEVQTVSTRNVTMRNALGLARLSDISQQMTTNDICAIVTNRVERYGKWTVTPPESDGESYSLTVFTNNYERLQAFLDVYYNGEPVASYESDGDYPLDATEISIDLGVYYVRRDVISNNALGLVMEKDLPQNTPVNELLLNGADGKVYHLRIGAGGSIDIYTEVSP